MGRSSRGRGMWTVVPAPPGGSHMGPRSRQSGFSVVSLSLWTPLPPAPSPRSVPSSLFHPLLSRGLSEYTLLTCVPSAKPPSHLLPGCRPSDLGPPLTGTGAPSCVLFPPSCQDIPNSAAHRHSAVRAPDGTQPWGGVADPQPACLDTAVAGGEGPENARRCATKTMKEKM